MKKTVIVTVSVFLALGLGLVIWRVQKPDNSTSTSSVDLQANNTQDNQSGTNNNQTETENALESNTVKISNFEFTPSKIKIKKGTIVTWTNDDAIRHDVKPDSETEEFKASELLSKGESYSVTFNTVGTYSYHCSPHPYMKGSVEVVE